eukprot:4953628-Amphidinium_carterae.1
MMQLNSTHVQLPAPNAVQVPQYSNFETAYALRYPELPELQYSYAIWEHQYSWMISSDNLAILVSISALVLSCSLLTAAGHS